MTAVISSIPDSLSVLPLQNRNTCCVNNGLAHEKDKSDAKNANNVRPMLKFEPVFFLFSSGGTISLRLYFFASEIMSKRQVKSGM